MNCLCKCNSLFISQYCYINNNAIYIDDYITNKLIYDTNELKCSNGHLLIPVINGKKRKPHFRHKNAIDLDHSNKMTEWHAEWQGNFPIVEKIFKKITLYNFIL